MAENASGGAGQGGKARDTFTGKTAFIISCIGSAVGLSGIWLFPYRVSEMGGAAYLIPYLIFVVLLGLTGVIGEMAFGRAMGTGPMGAFAKALEMRGVKHGSTIGKVLGFVPTVAALGIAIGYTVVLGWFLKYTVAALTGSLLNVPDVGVYFGELATDFGSIGWHVAALALTLAVMLAGISKGIERLNKVMMPLFFVLIVIIGIRVATLPGAFAGYEYLLVPRWEALADPKTWVYALGQAFFGLSLAGGGTLVYGSYLKKDVDVVSAAKNVVVFSTIAALLSALVVVPAVFAFGIDTQSGPPLLFIALPQVFQQMPMGGVFCFLFFLAVVCAAITSLVNLFEPPIEALQQQARLPRWAAVLVVAVVALAVGVFIESGDAVSNWMDAVSIYAMPVGALMAAVMFFWVCPKGFAKAQAQLGREKEIGRWFEPMTKYLFVGITAAVIVLGIFFGGIG
jgi:NSS family neurotransmitter:Na+ symporter